MFVRILVGLLLTLFGLARVYADGNSLECPDLFLGIPVIYQHSLFKNGFLGRHLGNEMYSVELGEKAQVYFQNELLVPDFNPGLRSLSLSRAEITALNSIDIGLAKKIIEQKTSFDVRLLALPDWKSALVKPENNRAKEYYKLVLATAELVLAGVSSNGFVVGPEGFRNGYLAERP